MRSRLLLAAVPAVAFVAAFAATLLVGSSTSDSGVQPDVILALAEPSRLPAVYLNVVAFEGARGRRITSPPRGAGLVTALDMQPDWSSAAGLIAFARETFTARGLGSPTKLYSVRPDGSGLRQLTAGEEVDRSPAWSPDGRRIAFARDTGGAFEIFVMDADGSKQVQLTAGSTSADEFPAWSPDGRRIAYASTAAENGDLYVMNADGSGAEQVTEGPGADTAPAWSPDGERLAFLRDGELHVAAADGSDVQALTDGDQTLMRPRWSPDGTRILFADDRGRAYVVGADGGEPDRLLVAGEVSWPTWKDGRPA